MNRRPIPTTNLSDVRQTGHRRLPRGSRAWLLGNTDAKPYSISDIVNPSPISTNKYRRPDIPTPPDIQI